MTRDAAKPKRRRTTSVPVTTMEELPVLSADERAELLRALEDAEGCVASGEAVEYESETFKSRLLSIYRDSRQRSE